MLKRVIMRAKQWRLSDRFLTMSFIVMSSSFDAPSISTEGLMATGGMGITLNSRSSGRPAAQDIEDIEC